MARVKLGEVATERRETHKGSKSGYPVVGLEHLISENINLSMWDESGVNTFTKMFHKGDVLFGRRRAYLKKAVIAPFDGICSGDITVIVARPEYILPELLPFVIQNEAFFDYAVGKSAGSLSPRVKWEYLREYEFDLPAMDEQRKLARVLWAVNDTIEAYKRLMSATEELVRGQFAEMFGNPLKNERGWEYRLLSEVTDIVLGSTPKSTEQAYWDGNIKWITPAEIQDNAFVINDTVRHLTPEGVKAASLKPFPAGTVIFSTRAPIGKTAIAGCEMYCNQGFKNFICKPELKPVYLFMLLRICKNYFINMGTGTTFKELSKSTLERVAISVPPLDLQQQFADFVHQADKSKSSLQKALTAAKNISRKIISDNLK